MSQNRPKIVVIDSNSLMHRAYHGLPPMNSADGTPTHAVYGFLSMLLKMLEQEKPDYLLAAFDTHAPTPRHLAYDGYKAKRMATPDDLRPQFPLVKEVLREMGIAVGEKDGFEADDFLGIFSRRGEAAGLEVRLLTGDKDALQLVDEHTTVILMRKGISETQVFDEAAICETYGLRPDQMADLKGLMGDSSDNIPGVPGVGEKTALKLMQQYGSMDEVLAHADEVKGPKLRQNLTEHAELARLSRQLGTIVTDVDAPIAIAIEDCAFDPHTMAGGREIMLRLGLRQIASRLPEGAPGLPKVQAAREEQRMAAVEITESDALQRAIDAMRSAAALAFVCEPADPCYTVSDGQTLWKIVLRVDLLNPGLDRDEADHALAQLLADASIEKRLYDVKAWTHRLDRMGLGLRNARFDAMLAAYLIQPNRTQPSLAQLVEETLGQPCDAAGLFALCAEQAERLKRDDLSLVYDKIEMPLVPVLSDMERTGFLIDRAMLDQLGSEYDASIEALKASIYALAGREFNILSPKQLGELLFEEMGLPAPKKTKTGYSTDAATLESLAGENPIVDKVLEYRQNSKLKSTYIEGLRNAADAQGRVHTQFKQNGTATGRLSSIEPNLQNIPVRSALGREIRRAFIPSEGNVLIDADYSQIELRILAHLAQDESMIEAFRRGYDIHAATAATVAGVDIADVTSEMRSAAKATNFGIVYGISDFGLANQLGISRKDAAAYIRAYNETYPGIARYMKDTVAAARAEGYVLTLFGRRRDLPELKSSNYHTRSFGERVARNAPIQGTAADIIKLAMIRVHEALAAERMRTKLILQVHDELILDAPPDERDAASALLKRCMESVATLDAPLLAEVHAGATWYEAK